MTKEEKELLLKDLSARLPYGLKVECEKYPFPVTVLYAGNIDEVKFVETGGIEHICLIKPYLRPMSSMTEEERKELSKILNYEFYVDDDFALVAEDDRHRIRIELCEGYMDWLNAHHFDYRIDPSTGKTLIESNLAIEAPKDMYKTE